MEDMWTYWVLSKRYHAATYQIVCAERALHRRLLPAYLTNVKDAQATQLLVNLAVFDLDVELFKAFRYPWAPAARNAALAVVFLEMKDIVPDLVAMLRAPAPTAPFAVKTPSGEDKMMVRELVRVNHHRNCMLCPPCERATGHPVGSPWNEALPRLIALGDQVTALRFGDLELFLCYRDTV